MIDGHRDVKEKLSSDVEEFYNLYRFFISLLAAPRPTLVNCQESSLTNRILITAFDTNLMGKSSRAS